VCRESHRSCGRLSHVASEKRRQRRSNVRQKPGVHHYTNPSNQRAAATVDVKAPQQMVPDEFCVGWLCKSRSCGRVIAIAATAPGGKPAAEFDDQLTAVKCRIVGMKICTTGALEANRSTARTMSGSRGNAGSSKAVVNCAPSGGAQ